MPAPDDELRRELAVVDLLTRAGQQVGPDDAARQRMRERVLAGFDAALAGKDADKDAGEDVATARQSPPSAPVDLAERREQRPEHGSDRVRGGRRGRRWGTSSVHGRLLIAAAASLCLLLSLSAMSLVFSRDALPGDALYGFKRSAESAELGLTFGDESRGFKHLQFATGRIDEIEALAARAGGDAGADAGRYLTALQAFDTDAAAGSRLLIDTANTGTGDQLAALRGWAEQQRQRLDAVKAALPSRAQASAGGSVALLTKVADRVSALQSRLTCDTVTSDARDDVGLLPSDGECLPVSTGPRAPNAPQQQGGQTAAPQSGGPAGLVVPGSTAGAQRGGPTTAANPANPLNPLDPRLPGGSAPGNPLPGGEPSVGAQSRAPITVPLPLPKVTTPALPGAQITGTR